MSTSPDSICATLTRIVGKLLRQLPGLAYAVHHFTEGFVVLIRFGSVPVEVLRALLPGVRPGVNPPTEEELRVLGHLVGGPLSGPDLAKRLDLQPDGGAFKERMAAIQARGLAHCPRAGYQLTEYGRWAFDRTTD